MNTPAQIFSTLIAGASLVWMAKGNLPMATYTIALAIFCLLLSKEKT